MKNRHAYLIIAHNKFDILEKLIKLIDDERNDIYIHIDKKVKDFDFNYFKSIAINSNLYFTKRISVNWGGFSQVKCELILLKEALKNSYDYYHLLSGVDLPLKTQDYIHEFFDKNYGVEFVHFATDNMDKLHGRVSRFHFLQEKRRSSKFIFKVFIVLVDNVIQYAQKILGFNRLKNVDFCLKYGSQWFSITKNLANYVVDNERWIKKHFSYSVCSDELFLQTLVYNTKFKEALPQDAYNGNYINSLRKIDWERGGPYIWRADNYEELINSDHLFARKFDSLIDNDIVEKIFEDISRMQNTTKIMK